MRPSADKTSHRPAIAGDRPNREYLRVASFLLPLAAFFVSLLCLLNVGMDADAQQPRAIVTGPKEARCGALVVLDASESQGTGRLWLLAVSPEETSFLPVESGLKAIFASPTAGRYTFVLVVSGTNSNGGPAADMATHTVTLSGGTAPADPTRPPNDPSQPPNRATAAVYVYEKDQSAIPRPVQAALQQLNAGGSIVASEFERDTTNGTGSVPEQYRTALDAAIKAGLPCLVVLSGQTVLRTVRDPKTEAQVTEAVK